MNKVVTSWNAQMEGGKYSIQFETTDKYIYKQVEQACQIAMDDTDIANAMKTNFRVGQFVKIIGDVSDATDHLDGMIGKIIEVFENDCYVDVDNGYWYIWNYNMTLLEDDLK